MNEEDTMPETLSEHEITITRTFDAPRELVWTAWTTPAQIEQWFAPRPVIVKPGSVVIDPRPGGVFSLTMVMPDGTEFPDHGSFSEFGGRATRLRRHHREPSRPDLRLDGRDVHRPR